MPAPDAQSVHLQPAMDLAAALAQHCAVDRGADGLHLPGWGPTEWARLVARGEPVRLGTGEPLMHHGENEARALYLVASGALEVTDGERRGESWSILFHEKPGSVVGEIAFFDGQPRTASVWATAPSVLLRLEAPALRRFMDDQPRLAAELLHAVCRVLAFRVRRGDQLGRAPSLY